MHYSYAYLLNKYQCSIIRTYKEPGCTLQRESQLTNIPPPHTHTHNQKPTISLAGIHYKKYLEKACKIKTSEKSSKSFNLKFSRLR